MKQTVLRHPGVRKLLILSTFLISAHSAAYFANSGDAASLTSTSVTLSNPRPSFIGKVAAGNTAGTSVLNIATSSNPSNDTYGLVSDDTIAIGVANSNSLTNYIIAAIPDSDTLSLDTTLSSDNVTAGRDVIATQSGTLTVRFNTVTAINGGTFRVLVPAAASNYNNGIPDQGKWDYGGATPTVNCPPDITNYDFGVGAAVAGSVTINSQLYHVFSCSYTGTGGVGTAFGNGNSNYMTIAGLINPGPASTTHTAGTADSYRIIVQHLDGSSTVIDSTTVAVGTIEPVRVTASVAPQISFTLAGTSSGATRCGAATTVTSTATTVPFGELSISTFARAAHTLSVGTNAPNGYSVTVLENDQMGRNADTCTGDNTGQNCIPDSVGDGSAMTHTNADEWASTSVYGLGYSLQSSSVSGLASLAFQHNTVSGSCGSGASCYKQFSDAEDSQTAQTILSSTGIASSDSIYVCYGVNVSAAQAAGDYENNLIYTATATF